MAPNLLSFLWNSLSLRDNGRIFLNFYMSILRIVRSQNVGINSSYLSTVSFNIHGFFFARSLQFRAYYAIWQTYPQMYETRQIFFYDSNTKSNKI